MGKIQRERAKMREKKVLSRIRVSQLSLCEILPKTFV